MKKTLLLIALAALAAGPAIAQAAQPALIEFIGAPDEVALPLQDEVTVYDSNGEAAFIGTPDFIQAVIKEDAVRIQAYDQRAMRVRITPYGDPELWLYCDDLQPMKLACATQISIADDGVMEIAPVEKNPDGPPPTAMQSARTPRCPGDARCPKI